MALRVRPTHWQTSAVFPLRSTVLESQRAVWWVVGEGEWGEDESGVRAREKRLKERLKRREKGNRPLSLPSNSLPSDNPPSLRNRIQSSTSGFPCLAGSGCFRPLLGVFPSPVLQILVGPPSSRSGFGPSSSPLFSLADGTDRPTTQDNPSCCSVVVPSRRSMQREKISPMNQRRETNELTIRMAVFHQRHPLPSKRSIRQESAQAGGGRLGLPSIAS